VTEREQTRFCLLEFRPRGFGYIPLRPASALILVTYSESAGLHVLADPQLHLAIDGEDLEYLRALLADWPKYARLDVAEFFRQIRAFGIGPLMLQAEGVDLFDEPSLVKLHSRFVEFE
jgi:hypothetical protein